MPPTDPPFTPPPSNAPVTQPTLAQADSRFDVLPDIPLPASLATMNPAAVGYLAWGQTLYRIRDLGLRAQPVAAPAGSALQEFHRTHSGRAWLIVDGLGIRVASEPQVPSPDLVGDNWVLLADEVMGFSPAELPDGDVVLATAWRYVFAAQAMPAATDLLARGSTPLDYRPAAAFMTIDPTQFVQTLLGPLPPVTSSLSIIKVGY